MNTRLVCGVALALALSGCGSPTAPSPALPGPSSLSPAAPGVAELTISRVMPPPGSVLQVNTDLTLIIAGTYQIGPPGAPLTLNISDQLGRSIFTMDSLMLPLGQDPDFTIQFPAVRIPTGTTAIDLRVSFNGTSLLDLRPAYHVH